ENILDLQISSRMQQRNGVEETLERPRAEMEPMIHCTFADEFFQQRGLDTGGKGGVQNTLNSHKSFFEADSVPDGSPEHHSMFDARLVHMLRTDLEKPVHGASEFCRCDPAFFANAGGGRCRHVRASLDVIELPVPDDNFVGGQVVVDVCEVNRENL